MRLGTTVVVVLHENFREDKKITGVLTKMYSQVIKIRKPNIAGIDEMFIPFSSIKYIYPKKGGN